MLFLEVRDSSILLMLLYLDSVLFISVQTARCQSNIAQRADLTQRMSQKPGGLLAMGSGNWTHMSLRIRNTSFGDYLIATLIRRACFYYYTGAL